MKVAIGKRLWRMSRKEYQGHLETAKQQVPMGVYAIEKGGYAELRNDRCESVTQLKRLIRQYKAEGFRALANRGRDERPL